VFTEGTKKFAKDLEKRGWEPLAKPASPRAAGFVGARLPGEHWRTYRHQRAPFGCQLLVQNDTERLGASQALLSLF